MSQLVLEGKAIKLADGVAVTDANNLKFMTLRVQKQSKVPGAAGSQIVIDNNQLLNVFNTVGFTGITDNVITYVDSNAEEGISAIAMDGGLKLDLEIKEGYLLLNDTKMSPELFNAIKGGVGDSSVASYNITVLSGTNVNVKLETTVFNK